MSRLRPLLLTALMAFPTLTFAQEAADTSLSRSVNPEQNASESADESAAAEKEDVPTPEETAEAFRRMIVTIRTNNGYTIHGIPTKPDLLPVTIFGGEAKVPWGAISSVRFNADGGVTVSLDDGNRLVGHSSLQFIELEKEWGGIRIYRDKIQSINQTQRSTTKQSSFRSSQLPQGMAPVGQPTSQPYVADSTERVPLPQLEYVQPRQ